MTYHTINSQSDIDLFLDRTNSLHDAYLIGVDYVHNGISGGNPCYFDWDKAELIPLGTPTWVWGKFYEFVIRSILAGGWKKEKGASTALNYWLGMDSGVIGVEYPPHLPEGVRQMAEILEEGLRNGTLDPFKRKIIAQDGTVKNDGSRHLRPEELLRMDWLCENIIGTIPPFEEILPYSQTMVRELGIYRDSIPTE